MDEIRVTVVKFGDRNALQLQYVDPITGKKKTRSAKTNIRREAERAAAKWEAELRAGRGQRYGRIWWDDFRERYEKEQAVFLADNTQGISATAFNHVERILAPKRLADITPAALSTLQSRMKAAGMREATISGYLGHLSAALKWAESVGLLERVPRVKRLRWAKGRDSLARGRPLTDAEFQGMLAKVPEVRPSDGEHWRRYLTGLWLGGLRLGESLLLSWDDDAPIKVDLSGKRPRLRIWAEAEKGRRDRLLPMTPDFAQHILSTPAGQRVGLVFPLGGGGKQMTDKRVSRAISEIGRLAGVIVNAAQNKPASAHDLRRTFGTRWAMRTVPAVLQVLMRHRSIETTLRYYVGLDADELAEGLWEKWGNG